MPQTANNNTIAIIGGLFLVTAAVIILLPKKKFANKKMTDAEFEKWLLSARMGWLENAVWGVKTQTEIKNLHPEYRNKIKTFFDRIEKETPYIPIITSGYRDSKKQAALYAENPSNAKPGYSLHEYGFAVDINLLDKRTGKVTIHKQSSAATWKDSGVLKIADNMGLKWGGVFQGYYDPVHFYIEPKGMTSTQLLALRNAKKVDQKGYVTV